MISWTQDAQLNRMPVDTTAIGTVQVCKYHIPMIVLKFGMQATAPFVIQLYPVHFFAPDRDRSVKIAFPKKGNAEIISEASLRERVGRFGEVINVSTCSIFVALFYPTLAQNLAVWDQLTFFLLRRAANMK